MVVEWWGVKEGNWNSLLSYMKNEKAARGNTPFKSSAHNKCGNASDDVS